MCSDSLSVIFSSCVGVHVWRTRSSLVTCHCSTCRTLVYQSVSLAVLVYVLEIPYVLAIGCAV